MTSGVTIAKMVIALGVIVLFVNLMAADPVMVEREPGLEPVGEWDALSNALQAGPQFPTFNDPFSGDSIYVHAYAVANVVPPNGPDSVTNCSATTWWNCINDNDVSTYVTDDSTIEFITTELGSPRRAIISIAVEATCRGNGADRAIVISTERYTFPSQGSSPTGAITCPQSTDFVHVVRSFTTITYTQVCCTIMTMESTDIWDDFGADNLLSMNPIGDVDIAEFRFVLLATTQVNCGTLGEWWALGDNLQVVGCQIGRFFDGVIKGFFFLVNGVIFVAQTVAALSIFFFSALGGLMLGLLNTFLFLLAIPGAPSIVQFAVAILVLGMLSFLVFTMAWMVRGTGPV